MTKFIKQHSGWFLAAIFIVVSILVLIYADSSYVKRVEGVSTIVLALLTSAYVIFTYQILKSTRPQPHVFATLPADETEILLSIKNIGTRPAYDVEVTFKPSLDTLAPGVHFKDAASPMLRQPFMPPESEVCNLISSTIQVLCDKAAPKLFSVHIRYRDYQFRWYSDSYEIDLNSYVFEQKYLRYDTKHYLKEVAETLGKINESIVKLGQPPTAN